MGETFEIIRDIIIATLAIVLVAALIMIPIVRVGFNAELDRYEVFVSTLEEARLGNVSEIENANILTKIADWNMHIASVRHWKETIFGVYIPKAVTELEFIK